MPYFQRAIALQRQAGNYAQVSALLVMIGHVYEQVNDQAKHNATVQVRFATNPAILLRRSGYNGTGLGSASDAGTARHLAGYRQTGLPAG